MYGEKLTAGPNVALYPWSWKRDMVMVNSTIITTNAMSTAKNANRVRMKNSQ